MDSFTEQWLIMISTPIYIIIIGVEILLTHFAHRKTYNWRDAATNFYLMLLNGGIDLLFRVVYLAILQYFYNLAIFSIEQVLLYWFVLLIAEDFLFYWLHRFDHQVRLLWAVHVTHHSSEEMNFTVGFRSSVFQPLYRFIYFIPLALCGFKPIDIVLIYSATQIWGIFVHTDLIKKMGWLEYVFVTPSHHRVHHASNPKYLDKNLGMFLIVWDKLFGTFQPELSPVEYEPLKYGLTSKIEKANAAHIVFHEWKSMSHDLRKQHLSWKQRLGYIFNLPGWSHDGSRLTSNQLRKKEEAEKDLSQLKGA